MQRNKGQRGEREVAEILSRALGVDVERKLGAARDGGHDIEAGVITMGRHQIPCNIPTFHIARGPNFQEWRKQHEE